MRLRVVRDKNPESPNCWGGEGMFLVYDHRQFNVVREGFATSDVFKHLEAKNHVDSGELSGQVLQEWKDELEMQEDFSKDYFIFQVNAYIHSGVSLSLGGFGEGSSFDTSTTGYILVDRSEVQTSGEWYDKYHKGKTADEVAIDMAVGLIDVWNTYLNGDVFGFILERPEHEYILHGSDLESMLSSGNFTSAKFLELAEKREIFEEVDSCWGFYGDDWETNGMKDHIEEKDLVNLTVVKEE